jgi:hypothetical protein
VSQVAHQLNALESIVRCTVEPVAIFANGARSWVVNLDSIADDEVGSQPFVAQLRHLHAARRKVMFLNR